MCYSGHCRYENYYGECNHKWNEPDAMCNQEYDEEEEQEDVKSFKM
jgi:hypothetical protein